MLALAGVVSVLVLLVVAYRIGVRDGRREGYAEAWRHAEEADKQIAKLAAEKADSAVRLAESLKIAELNVDHRRMPRA